MEEEKIYCEHCNLRTFHEYNYKPEPVFYGEGERYFGVELEIDNGGKDDYYAEEILYIANYNDDCIYIKSDSSLDDGMEIVSQPMTLDYHKNYRWERIMQKAVSLGYRSHQTSTCGLHIHVNRDAFAGYREEQEDVLAKILYFVEHHWNELLKFSRRTEYTIRGGILIMCALYGWLDCGKKLPHRLLKKLTQALATAAEERGTDATGISYIKNGRVTIYKRPKPAHKIKFNIPENTVAVMGHTRFATQGDKQNNYNNHPFPAHADKNFALAHNGVLYNDVALRKHYNLPETEIETDSYIAVKLIEMQQRLDFETLSRMAEDVHGSFVFTILDENNTLYFVKGSNPLYLIYFERLGLYVYASTKSIMDNALKAVCMQYEKYAVIEVDEGDIISIDKNGIIDTGCFEPEISSFLATKNRYSFYDDWYNFDGDESYTDEEELLLDMCNCLGIDEDDVTLLLEYGYTAMEIDDLIADTDLFITTVNEIKSLAE